MNDAGLFDKLVDGLVHKAGKNVTLILVFTSIIAMIGHIDGAAATTYLITHSHYASYLQENAYPADRTVAALWGGHRNHESGSVGRAYRSRGHYG